MSKEGVGVIALIVGATGGALWSRWRHQVVKELRIIRRILQTEQEPVLRTIRDLLVQDAEKAAPEEERPSDTEEEEGPSYP